MRNQSKQTIGNVWRDNHSGNKTLYETKHKNTESEYEHKVDDDDANFFILFDTTSYRTPEFPKLINEHSKIK